MTFWLEKSFTFEAMHYLTYHDGKCSRPHGHSYQVTVRLSGKQLETQGPKKNMLTDFSCISVVCKDLKEKYLDHYCLNETLETDSPTSEFIAQWIYQQLKPQLPLLSAVIVSETNTSRAIYQPDTTDGDQIK
ncbi:6-carboxy-5,6,7,8-tetrahydropterin synthase [Galdieria sulphuraria]|nr:6-carboxy-5,6,7,8-tetrahydropterin synthase [Galdieria sulphuraria]